MYSLIFVVYLFYIYELIPHICVLSRNVTPVLDVFEAYGIMGTDVGNNTSKFELKSKLGQN